VRSPLGTDSHGGNYVAPEGDLEGHVRGGMWSGVEGFRNVWQRGGYIPLKLDKSVCK
jgi:hypothetical protein